MQGCTGIPVTTGMVFGTTYDSCIPEAISTKLVCEPQNLGDTYLSKFHEIWIYLDMAQFVDFILIRAVDK